MCPPTPPSSSPIVTSQAVDANYFAYVLTGQTLIRNGFQQWTSLKNITRGGGTQPPTGAPVPPTFPAAVAATVSVTVG